jgi:hypothetical protein
LTNLVGVLFGATKYITFTYIPSSWPSTVDAIHSRWRAPRSVGQSALLTGHSLHIGTGVGPHATRDKTGCPVNVCHAVVSTPGGYKSHTYPSLSSVCGTETQAVIFHQMCYKYCLHGPLGQSPYPLQLMEKPTVNLKIPRTFKIQNSHR